MTFKTKLLLAGLVATAAIAMTAVPSEAAKKKVAAKCEPLSSCSVCKGATCEVRRCDADGKWYSTLLISSPMCTQPNCPSKC
jgi:hypothetical protein